MPRGRRQEDPATAPPCSRRERDRLTQRPAFLFLIALTLGLVSALGFEPIGAWPLTIAAIAGLAELLSRTEKMRNALLYGWAFGVGQFVLGLNWIATAFTFQAKMPAWLGWIAVVLLALYLAVYPMISAGLAWAYGRKRHVALVLALAGSWTITEWLRAVIFTGFAWNPLGVALVDTPWIEASAWIGTYGLSLLVVLLGGAAWLAWKKYWKSVGGIGLAALLALALPGATLIEQSTETPVRIVQPNIGQQDKWREGFEFVAAQKLAEQTRLPFSADTPSIIFWPEAAVTDPLVDERVRAEPITAFERMRAAGNIPPDAILITGGIGLLSEDGERVSGATNSVFTLNRGAEIIGRYDKAHLVPYGEYLPMRPLLSAIGLSRLAPGDLDFRPGPGPQTLNIEGLPKMGFQVCYEIIFSGQVVDADNRPDLIFNPSNDAWFGSFGPPQHLAQARLRAAEEGIPVVRSTPTGISALISARGELLAALPLGDAGKIDATLPATGEPTLFSRLGNLIPLILGFALLIAAIALGRSGRYSRT